MHVRSKLSLATLVILGIAVLIVVVSTAGIMKRYIIEPKKELVKQAAGEMSGNYQRMLSNISVSLTYLSKLTTLQYVAESAYEGDFGSDYQEATDILHKNLITINSANEYILDSYLCDRYGKVLVSTNMISIGNTFAMRHLLSAMGEADKIYFFNKNEDGQNSLWMGLSVYNEQGKIMGYVLDHISIDFFTDLAMHTTTVKNGILLVLDVKGDVLLNVQSGKTAGLPRSMAVPQIGELLEKMQNGEGSSEGNLDYVVNGQRFLGYYVTMPEYGWLLISAMSQAELAQVRRNIILVNTGILGTMTLIALLIAAYLSRVITKPLDLLTKTVKEVGAGNFDIRCPVIQENDEFGQLAQGFNGMLDELEKSRISLENSERRYRMAIEGVNEIVWEYDVATRNLYVSDKWEQLFGYNINGGFQRWWLIKKYLHPQDIGNFLDFTNYNPNGKETVIQSQEFRVKKQDGTYVWLMAKGNIYTDNAGGAVKIVGSAANVSKRKQQEEEIKQLAYYDQTTGLLNNIRFGELLEEEIRKYPLKPKALLFINLNRFHHINEALGYQYGNYILRKLGACVKNIAAEGYAGRMGGDQFIVLLPYCPERSVAFGLAEKIVSGIAETTRQVGTIVELTSSVGIAFYPDQGSGPDELMKNTGIALLRSKQDQKGNHVEAFSLSMLSEVQNQNAIFAVLRNALNTGEMQLYFQPQYDLRTDKIYSLEALSRLFSKELGFISPSAFIPLAEEREFILPLGDWTLKKAVQALLDMQNAGLSFEKIAVNLSLSQLLDAGFIGRVRGLLRQTGVDPKKIEFEITESVLLKSFEYG